jgi:hypothetical protein
MKVRKMPNFLCEINFWPLTLNIANIYRFGMQISLPSTSSLLHHQGESKFLIADVLSHAERSIWQNSGRNKHP